MYAVIEIKWHQYIVSQWDKIIVDKVWEEEWKSITVDTVLTVFDSEWNDVKVGDPYVKGVKIKLKVLENKKWEKINVLKFKNKNRYQRKIWFRPHISVLEIEKLDI